jgi:hypothetical protein
MVQQTLQARQAWQLLINIGMLYKIFMYLVKTMHVLYERKRKNMKGNGPSWTALERVADYTSQK